MATLTDGDEGKILVDASGKDIGIVTAVSSDRALVDPEPGFVEGLLAAFGRTDGDSDDVEVPHDAVETVTDREVRLRETL
ncbi:hypothetical protein [Halomarina oriensis]|uniref:PRC-barrel domain containing protein n=1 Tax=Halomarina oriensis TaxID=671145 RepID=A0A6B0GJC1_9EURY|nr:hypothetical protein [Halomarina oriensis]MWG34884.1 hypothetical protein [Halomarina oriensis]